MHNSRKHSHNSRLGLGHWLERLAHMDFELFEVEWRRFLLKQAKEARRRAGLLVEEEGAPVPPAYDILDETLELLDACGPKACEAVREETVRLLGTVCDKGIRQAYGYRR